MLDAGDRDRAGALARIPAAAQSLLGTVTSSSGVGQITTGTGTTTVSVISPQAVINWSANGPSNAGVTTFSNAGSTTTFTGASNFAVLNRVAPTVGGDSILMGGNINSTVNGQVGGTVYFYSPNGIVIGSGATINVGSLGLTTLPIADVQGVWMSGFGGTGAAGQFRGRDQWCQRRAHIGGQRAQRQWLRQLCRVGRAAGRASRDHSHR